MYDSNFCEFATRSLLTVVFISQSGNDHSVFIFTHGVSRTTLSNMSLLFLHSRIQSETDLASFSPHDKLSCKALSFISYCKASVSG